MLAIDLLSTDQVAEIRRLIDGADWVDGGVTAGAQSGAVKRNTQLPETSPASRAARRIVEDALGANARFLSAALPLKIFPPLFNRYKVGDGFGTHVDNAIRPVAGSAERVRTDLSATLFLTDPSDYDGGELVIGAGEDAPAVRLAAGQMVLYPSKSLHHVTPVTRGMRTSCFFWVQSMVRDDGARDLLHDLDGVIQDIATRDGVADPHAVRLSGLYHNLVRRWADS